MLQSSLEVVSSTSSLPIHRADQSPGLNNPVDQLRVSLHGEVRPRWSRICTFQ